MSFKVNVTYRGDLGSWDSDISGVRRKSRGRVLDVSPGASTPPLSYFARRKDGATGKH